MSHADPTAAEPTPEIRRFALIIGAMKSGTTSLFEYLAAHPAIAPCSVKEPNFFSDPDRWAEGMDAYRRLWDWDPATHRVALEASTAYTKPDSAGGAGVVALRISKLDAEFRFIYVMRDPVERVVSHLSHTATERGGADRVGPDDFRWALDVSRYATRLDAYRERFPRDAILPLVHEALIDDPEAAVRRVHGFLGLEPGPVDDAVLNRAYNTRVEMAAGTAAARWVGGDRALGWIRRWTPGPVLRWARGVVGRRSAHVYTLSESERAEAVEELAPEVARLRAEWSVDTSWWDPALRPGAGGGT